MQQRPSLTICRGCGVIWPSDQSRCDRCGTNHDASGVMQVPPRQDRMVWARVEAEFTCRSCGFAVALNHFDLDGSALCDSCGINQALSGDVWESVIAHAHLIADYAGPFAPPHGDPAWDELDADETSHIRRIGTSTTSCTMEREPWGGIPHEVSASTGYPVCTRCSVPLDVQLDAGGGATGRCPQCGDAAAYDLPPRASELEAVRAALAPDHRTDVPPVQAVAPSGGGAVALQCPSCQAPLSSTGAGEVTTCGYCHTASLVPARVWKQHGGEPQKKRPWWILFGRPSAPRRAAQEKQQRAAENARREAEARAAIAAKEGPIVARMKRAGYVATAVFALCLVGAIAYPAHAVLAACAVSLLVAFILVERPLRRAIDRPDFFAFALRFYLPAALLLPLIGQVGALGCVFRLRRGKLKQMGSTVNVTFSQGAVTLERGEGLPAAAFFLVVALVYPVAVIRAVLALL